MVFPHFLVVRMKGVGVLPVGAPTGPGVRGLGEGSIIAANGEIAGLCVTLPGGDYQVATGG